MPVSGSFGQFVVSVRCVRDFPYQDLHVHLIELVDLKHFDPCPAYVEKWPGLAGTLSWVLSLDGDNTRVWEWTIFKIACDVSWCGIKLNDRPEVWATVGQLLLISSPSLLPALHCCSTVFVIAPVNIAPTTIAHSWSHHDFTNNQCTDGKVNSQGDGHSEYCN